MMRKLILIFGVYLLCMLGVRAQQVPLYSQYLMNGFLLNPAIAGAEGYSVANVTAREQWVGLQGGPATYALSYQTRLLNKSYIDRSFGLRRGTPTNKRGGKVGLGAHIFSHNNGAVNRLGIKFSYAYHIRFTSSQLSYGLSLLAYQYRLNDEKINFKNEFDQLWSGIHQTIFIPEAEVGIYYTRRQMWAGFSVDNLFESILKFGDAGYDELVLQRNYYLLGGLDFPLSRFVTVSPSAFVKYAESGMLQADLGAKLHFNQEYWIGASYRTGQTIIVNVGLSIDRFVFGYAYDISLNGIMRYTYGTHEFTFAVKVGNSIERYRWINRY